MLLKIVLLIEMDYEQSFTQEALTAKQPQEQLIEESVEEA